MILQLSRWPSTEKSTIGKLFLPDTFVYTLEDPVRKMKIPGTTAIPAGTYQVKITFSKRFQKELPILLDVPGYEGVRVHAGNTAEDTEGCILVGLSKDVDSIYSSKTALKLVMDEFKKILDKEDLFIQITNA